MKTGAKKIIANSFAVLLTVSVLGYAYFRAQDFLIGPVVVFETPKNGATVTSPVLTVAGTSRNLSFISLNGRKIFTDKNGDWNEKIALSPGYNIIEADVKDRFGCEVKKTLQVIYRETAQEPISG
jgi:hypothetical protein